MSNSVVRYKVDGGVHPRLGEDELRVQIEQVCGLMWERGFVAAGDGNVSARLGPNRFLCTPSGFSKRQIGAEMLLVVDGRARSTGPQTPQSQGLRPSSELLLHLAAYEERDDVMAVVHAHPPTAIALSTAGVSLAHTLIPDVVLALGIVPTAAYATPASAEGAAAVREPVRRHDALILPRHGSVTTGHTPMEAYLKLEKVEQLAQITLMVQQLGGAPPLPPEELAKLLDWRREQGLLRPGEEEAIRRAGSAEKNPSDSI